MKKLFLVLTAALVLSVASATAEDPGNDKTFAVNVNLWGILFNLYSGSLETKLPIPLVTAKADVSWSPNFFWVSNMSGLDLQATGRFYYGSLLPFQIGAPFDFLKKGPLQGLYAGGGVSVHTWAWNYGSDELSYFSPGIVIEGGAKYFGKDLSWWPKDFYLEGGLVLDIVMPAKWKYKSGGSEWAGIDSPYSRGGIGFQTNVGYAF